MRQTALSRPMPNASLPRNSFPRGFCKRFNMSTGMLLPVFAQFVPLGSKFRLNRSIFLRTAQLNTAAFPLIDFNIDFYVVPLRLLMTRYDEFKTNTQDLNSSAFSSTHVPSRMPYFKLSDIHSTIVSPSFTPGTDLLGVDLKYGAARLFDLLGYDDANLAGLASGYDAEYNAFRLLAYQKIYYDHYRNTAYEANEPLAYNADHAYLSGGDGYISGQLALQKMCELHYVNYRKDYFQAVYPGLNYVMSGVEFDQDPWSLPHSLVGALSSSALNVTGITSNDQERWRTFGTPSTISQQNAQFVTGLNTNLQTSSGVPVQHDHSFNASTTVYQSPTSLTNVQAIRAAFALDKLMRASAYAPKHVKDQLEARYGVKLRQSYGNESIRIGSFGNQITIGEVTSTANTDTGSSGDKLGAIGGKGVSGDPYGKTISYTVESDCIVMGIAYGLSRSMYDSHRIDNFNQKHLREDLPVPEFMDLGLRPLLLSELFHVQNVTLDNQAIGYVTRDQEYKIGIDENHGLFRDGQPLGVYTVHTNSANRLTPGSPIGILSTAAYFKVSPSDLNSIFAQNFDPTDQLTDQIFGQIEFKFDVRQNMSIHGQPRL